MDEIHPSAEWVTSGFVGLQWLPRKIMSMRLELQDSE